jgi:Uma2 family endonuclease
MSLCAKPASQWVELARFRTIFDRMRRQGWRIGKGMSDAAAKRTMNVHEFTDGAMRQDTGRHELVPGEILSMAPKRAQHNRFKGEVYVALRAALLASGVDCAASTNGMTVVVDDDTARGPDALASGGKPIHLDTRIADAPIIVVEVTSPSSERDDTGRKLTEILGRLDQAPSHR